jgi:hypothetical protein
MAKVQEVEYFFTQPRGIPMTFMHIPDSSLPKHALGERRSDDDTAARVDDALRARGRQAAAQAMQHQHIDFALALRVMADQGRRRMPANGVANFPSSGAARSSSTGCPPPVAVAA